MRKGKLASKYIDTAIPRMAALFRGEIPGMDPTEENKISAERLSIWLEEKFGYKDGKTKDGGRSCINVRNCVNYIRKNCLAPICSSREEGYFRATKPEHYDKTYTQLMNRIDGLLNPIEGMKKMKEIHFPGLPIERLHDADEENFLYDDL
jgi:hypothetical protein